MTNENVNINAHPFFHGEFGKTERELLLKLTPLCNWDTSVGIVNHLPDVPHLKIGLVDEKKFNPNKLPYFTQVIGIELSSRMNPCTFITPFDPDFCKNVLNPLFKNWITFTEMVYEIANGKHFSKDYLRKNIEYWKEYPIADYPALYFNPHNH